MFALHAIMLYIWLYRNSTHTFCWFELWVSYMSWNFEVVTLFMCENVESMKIKFESDEDNSFDVLRNDSILFHVFRRKWLWVTDCILLEILSTDLLKDFIYTFCLLQRMQQQSNISHVMRISHISHMRMCIINWRNHQFYDITIWRFKLNRLTSRMLFVVSNFSFNIFIKDI